MLISRKSPITGNTNERDLEITSEQYLAWKTGVPIQNAMPDLSADDRVFIVSGLTEEDREYLFGGTAE